MYPKGVYRCAARPLAFGVAVLLVLGLVLSACATPPRIDHLLHSRALDKRTPRFADAQGPLTAAQGKVIFERLQRQNGKTDILQRHMALEEAIVGSPLIVGNKVTLLQDGPATYQAMFRAMQNARDHINLETYIFDDDEIGTSLAKLLMTKQQSGVQVNVMYDSVGALSTAPSFFDVLRENGVAVVEFNPINPLQVKKEWLVNRRDHRKIIIVDGTIAFTGGMNISDVYAHGSFVLKPGQEDAALSPWRDVHVQIEGPVVAEFQKLFMQAWEQQEDAEPVPRNYFPKPTRQGDHLVRAIGGSPDTPLNLIYVTLISAIFNAEKSVYLTNAYFVPDPQLLAAIKEAAQRGVDVKLVLPGYSDFWAVFHAGRSFYSELLAAGVQIYEHQAALLHAKTAVIDGVWSTVGSTNLDWRSFLHNYEVNAVVLGQGFAREMEAMFAVDLKGSSRIEQAQWEARSLGLRMKEWLARMWAYWL